MQFIKKSTCIFADGMAFRWGLASVTDRKVFQTTKVIAKKEFKNAIFL